MKKPFLCLILCLIFTGCTSITATDNKRTPSSAKFTADELEMDKSDEKFAEFMQNLDLENSTTINSQENIGKYYLTYKKTSTSAGMRVELIELKDNKLNLDGKGKWVPTNSANDVEAQVVAYNLARFLKMGDLVVPSAYYTAGPKALNHFKAMLNCEKEKGQHRDNCINLRNAIKKNPNSMIGSYVDQVKGEVEVTGMNTFKGSLATNGKLNKSHIIAKFIDAVGPLPSAEKRIELVAFKENNKVVKPTETELELARQFSKIMVLDILTGQWDRFSGGNIEAIHKKKKDKSKPESEDAKIDVVQFMAIDNGGASMKGDAKLLYWEAVSRFDREQIQRVEHLLDLLTNDSEATVAGLQLKSKPDSLIKRINKLLEHVQSNVKKHGESKVFFAD